MTPDETRPFAADIVENTGDAMGRLHQAIQSGRQGAVLAHSQVPPEREVLQPPKVQLIELGEGGVERRVDMSTGVSVPDRRQGGLEQVTSYFPAVREAPANPTQPPVAQAPLVPVPMAMQRVRFSGDNLPGDYEGVYNQVILVESPDPARLPILVLVYDNRYQGARFIPKVMKDRKFLTATLLDAPTPEGLFPQVEVECLGIEFDDGQHTRYVLAVHRQLDNAEE